MEGVSIDRRAQDGWVVLAVRGPVDVATMVDVQQHATAALRDGHVFVAIDAERIDFVDEFAIGALVAIRRRLTAAGGRLVLVGPSAELASRLASAGLTVEVAADLGQLPPAA